MFCGQCGFELPADSSFCAACGKQTATSPAFTAAGTSDDALPAAPDGEALQPRTQAKPAGDSSNSRTLTWTVVTMLLASVAVVLIVHYFNKPNSVQNSNPIPTAVAAPSAPPTVKDPFGEAAKKYISRHFLKCGSDFYASHTGWNRHYHFNNLQWTYDMQPASQTDTLNGIDWKATLHIRCQAYRDTEFSNSWSQWQSCAGTGMTAYMSFKPDVAMISRRGKVSYSFAGSLESLGESGNSQVVEMLSSSNRTCRFYQALASAN
jgi:hypothetical protein